jgi:phosphotriesterase-related protein
MTEYERMVFEAAARASVATGAPITTHTDRGTVGDLQQTVLTDGGVPAHRVIIGHSCGTTDTGYHAGIAERGSYLGFDRFGIGALMPDVERVASLARLLDRGAGDRVVVSHDSVWCWRGEPFPAVAMGRLTDLFDPTRFDREIVPMLHDSGVTAEQVDALVVDNPRRFFEGELLPSLPEPS